MNTLESVKNWGYSRGNNIFNSDYLFCRESQQYLSIIKTDKQIYATKKILPFFYSILYTIHTYLYISVMLMIVLITVTKMYKLKSMWTIWLK